MSKKNYFFVSTIIICAILSSGYFGSQLNSDTISKNLINKQKEITDMSYDEKLTIFDGNKSITTVSNYLIKKPSMFKRVDLVNSSIYFIAISDGKKTWGYDPIKNTAYFRSNASQAPSFSSPMYEEFLSYMSNNCTENYKNIEYLNGVKACKLEIFPDKQNEYDNLSYILWVDPKIWMPLKIQSYSGGKLLMTSEYENYSINSGIKDSEFEFKPPKGTTVVDI